MTPQDTTITTYIENFDEYKEKTPNKVSGEFIPLLDDFCTRLPKNGTVLEIGSAHGRDARYLRDKSFSVTCTDIIPQALDQLHHEGFVTSLYDLRNEPKKEWINSFDGIFAKAVFLHATQEQLEKSLDSLSECLKTNGIFCITFKCGVGEEIETDKLGGERYFKYYTKVELEELVQKHTQFELISVTVTSDEKWIQIILQKTQ
jgi:SAM-dependent methyltransferase